MKISVIIPVYNVEKYLLRCLDSVAGQTIFVSDPSVEVQCILVDDCGTDSSMSIAREYVGSYTGPVQWIVVKHTHNRGLAAARNTGLDMATGDYVMFVDSDDSLPSESLQSMSKAIHLHPGVDLIQGIALFSDREVFPPAIKLHNLESLSGVEYTDKAGEAFNYFITYRLPGEAWAKLVRRQFLIDYDLQFLEEIRMFEDWEWCFRMTQLASKAVLVHTPTYNYAVGVPGSLTRSSQLAKMNTWKRVYKEVISLGVPIVYPQKAAYRLIGNWFYHRNVVPGIFDDLLGELAQWAKECGLSVPAFLLRLRSRSKSSAMHKIIDSVLYRICASRFVHPLV